MEIQQPEKNVERKQTWNYATTAGLRLDPPLQQRAKPKWSADGPLG